MVRLGAQNKPPRAALGAKVTWQQIRTFYSSTDQGGGKAAVGHSISRFFRRLSPFPFAGLPVVTGDTALDHFVAPAVACDDKGDQVATAEAKRAERCHDDELQQLTHCNKLPLDIRRNSPRLITGLT
jgi:hypothetical protein